MASTPVKTMLVDRLRTGLAGASADATALKGKTSPEQVRQFESLLDQTNKAAPAQKPAPARSTATSSAAARKEPPAAPEKPDVRAPAKPDVSEKTAAASETATEEEALSAKTTETVPSTTDTEAANIADAPVAGAASSEPPAEPQAVVVDGTAPPARETPADDGMAGVDAAPRVAEVPQPLPLPLPQPVDAGPVADLPPAPTTAAPAPSSVPVDTDLAKQEPVILPQAVAPETLPETLPAAETASAAGSSLPTAPTATAGVPPAQPTAEAKTVATPPAPATSPLLAAAPQQQGNDPAIELQGGAQTNPPQTDAVIESLTVVASGTDAAPAATPDAPAATTKEAAPTVDAKTVDAKTADAKTVDAKPETIAAQTATAAPIIADGQPKAKAASATPSAETPTGKSTDGLTATPTSEAVPASTDETSGDPGSNRDPSHGDKARERGQERAQSGERLAAKLADSQAALIRDEVALSGPVQSFKAALKSTPAESLAPAVTTRGPDEPAKQISSTQPSLSPTATTSASAPQTAAAAKAAARSAPVYQTPVVQQVGTRLVETAENGGGRVVMDLRPEHLGRVTIDVDVRDDGRVSATVLVDNPEALEQLRRDSAQLEQALRDSGLNPDQNSLNFGLREQNQDQGGYGRDGRNGRGANSAAHAETDAAPEMAKATLQQSVVPGLGVIDIRI